MKKNWMKKQTWAKLLAAVIAAVSAIAILFCGFFTILFGVVEEFGKQPEAMRDAVNRQLLNGYMVELYEGSGLAANWPAEDTDEPVWDSLDGGNIRYTVVEDTGRTVYTNDPSVDEEHCLLSEAVTPGMGMEISGTRRDEFWTLLSGDRRILHTDSSETTYIENAVYDKETGFFYWKDQAGKYFLVSEFTLMPNDVDISPKEYVLENRNGQQQVYVDESGAALLSETVEKKWAKGEGFLSLNHEVDAAFEQDTDELDLTIYTVDSIPKEDLVEMEWCECSMEDAEVRMHYEEKAGSFKQTGYQIYMDVADSIGENQTLHNGMADYFPQAEKLSSFLLHLRHTSGWYLALSVLLFLGAFVFLMQAAGRRRQDDEIHLRVVDKVPFGILTFIAGGLVVGCVLFGILMIEVFFYGSISFALASAGGIMAMCACSAVMLGYCMSIAVRVKTKKFWRYTILHYLWTPFRWGIKMLKTRTPMFLKAIAIFGGVSVIEAIGIGACLYDGGAMFCFCFLWKIAEFALLVWLLYQMHRIREGGKRIAAGDYSHPIDTSHMMWELKKHAENINNVGNGISQAVEAKMKSERFKTELITNVSHDIKTPLTSIINYVDLMKKEEIENPTVQGYIEVLDHQSARLKKLIEDLMEASKASTGNLPVHLEVCDATVMLTQVVGEFKERADANQLELVVESPDPPVNIMADGRHLWRIIDNLMSNICKYAQPGTRVYINLEKYNGMVIMTFRNISKSRLNISSDELMERFVRGDSSRNTEGNGLGLSIAQSLTSLMDGNLAIQIDGDLFKVILSFDEHR